MGAEAEGCVRLRLWEDTDEIIERKGVCGSVRGGCRYRMTWAGDDGEGRWIMRQLLTWVQATATRSK